jgi:hypothetical protein
MVHAPWAISLSVDGQIGFPDSKMDLVGRHKRRADKAMKVFGGLMMNPKRCREHGGQVRTVIAAKSQKEAARKIGCSLYEFRTYWMETGNAEECASAMTAPGIIFQATTSMGLDFEPIDGRHR